MPRKSRTPSAGQIYKELREFISSPIWVLPIMSFIEQKSIIFDKDQQDEEAFREVFEEYRAMCDMLLSSFCDDLDVQHTDLTRALDNVKPNLRSEEEKSALEPIVASQEYKVFLHMMMRKNIELQLQALHMLEVVYGVVPGIVAPCGKENGSTDQDQVIMIEVIRRSQEEYEQMQHLSETEKRDLEEAMKESQAERRRLEADQRREQEMLERALRLSADEYIDSQTRQAGANETAVWEPTPSTFEHGAAHSATAHATATQIQRDTAERNDSKDTAGIVTVPTTKSSVTVNAGSTKPEPKHADHVVSGAEKPSAGIVTVPTTKTVNAGSAKPDPKHADLVSGAAKPSKTPTEGTKGGQPPGPARADEQKARKSRKQERTSKVDMSLPPVRGPTSTSKPLETSGRLAFDPEPDLGHTQNADDAGMPKVALLPRAGHGLPADAELRKKYLLEQRKKLLEMKAEERKRAFDKAENEAIPSRPRTAKAARDALSGSVTVDKKTLEARKALADKLKAAMMGD